jgi:hypothetical protein
MGRRPPLRNLPRDGVAVAVRSDIFGEFHHRQLVDLVDLQLGAVKGSLSHHCFDDHFVRRTEDLVRAYLSNVVYHSMKGLLQVSPEVSAGEQLGHSSVSMWRVLHRGSPAAGDVGHLVAAGMLFLEGNGRGLPFDYDELERWTRVGYERGMRSRMGER